MYGPMHQKIIDALARLGRQPVRYVVNTHLHGDHTGGNEAMAKLGAVILSHGNMRKRMEDIGGGFSIGSVPEGGTVIRLSAPLGNDKVDAAPTNL